MARHSLSSPTTNVATLRDYLQVIRRRKWTIVQSAVLVPIAALAFSLTQQKLYQASAQVLLSSQNLAAELTGTQQYNGVSLTPDRIAQTQADVARVPTIAQRVLLQVAGTGLTVQRFLSRSSVTTATNADILGFHVTNHDPELAKRLVDAYAKAYTIYRRQLDTASIQTALAGVDSRVRALQKSGDSHSALYAGLVERQQTLQTMEALQTANASVVQEADVVVKTQPKTTRNVILGVLLGVFLGIGLAFLREALDTRVRSAETVSEALHLPLLARLAAPAKKLRRDNQLVMMEEPKSVEAEAFRMLRTNIEFASLGKDPRTIMITSATEQEGKSTTIANLAIAFAKAGEHVVLVDLDLRRPFVDRFFGLEGRPGITQVAIGAAALGDAIVRIPVTQDDGLSSYLTSGNESRSPNGTGVQRRLTLGALDVLPAGPIPPDPGEFVGAARLTEILTHLANHCDVVLIDAPPLFHVGDAMTLSAKVDAVVVVARIEAMRRPMLTELHRLLETMPAHKLGFVITGAETEEAYGGYGYGYGTYYARPYAHEQVASRS